VFVASGGQGLDEMLAHCSLKFAVVHVDRRGQERLEDVQSLGIELSRIALGIGFGRPQADGDYLFFSHLLGVEGQNLQEAGLLHDFVFYDLHELFFLFRFHFKIKNTCKHG
jgi:hypothetical protein